MRQCLDCKDKYGWTEDEPTLNCEVSRHRIYDTAAIEKERAFFRQVAHQSARPLRKDTRRGRGGKYVPREWVPPTSHPTGFISAAEMARRWGVSESLIARWCRRDRFPGAFRGATNRTGRKWYIPIATQRPPRNQTKSRDTLSTL